MALNFLNRIGFGQATDEELLKRYRRTKDQQYLAQLFGRYVHMIYGLCLRYSPDVREAEDLTMEIYEKLCDKALGHKIRNFKSWLYIVGKNHCLEQIRKLTGRKIVEFDPEFVQFAAEVHHDTEVDDKVEEELRYELLEKCLQRLNDSQRISLELFYLKNKSYAEIASIMENEVSHVRSFLQNGRRNMKRCVEKNGM